MARRLCILLLGSLLIFSFGVVAQSDTEQSLREGIRLIHSTERNKGFDILLPLAKKGNTEAMYNIGLMLSRASDIDDHINKSMKFLKTAAEKGHASSRILIDVIALEGQIRRDGIKIPAAIRDRLISESEIQKLGQGARNKALQRDGSDVVDSDQVTVSVFFTGLGSWVNKVIVKQKEVSRIQSVNVNFIYHIVFDELLPFSQTDMQNGSMVPDGGLTPDYKGDEALKLGIKSFPAIAITKNGKTDIVSDINQIIPYL